MNTMPWVVNPGSSNSSARRRRSRPTIAYDPITGGVSSITSSVTGTINYDYDNATGRLTHTWTSANDSVYVYDDFGRLQTVSQSKLNNSPVDLTTTYTYDAVGNLDTVTQPNGVKTDYDYDGLNRLVKETVQQSDGDKRFEQDYTLLDNGQRAQVIEKGQGRGPSMAPI